LIARLAEAVLAAAGTAAKTAAAGIDAWEAAATGAHPRPTELAELPGKATGTGSRAREARAILAAPGAVLRTAEAAVGPEAEAVLAHRRRWAHLADLAVEPALRFGGA
jgi:hypothetical protein